MTGQRLNLLDGLRGLAAFAIILWHYRYFFLVWPDSPSLPDWDALQPGRPVLNLFLDHGLRAVELFWVISGFVFTHVYCLAKTGGKDTTTRAFAVNRFARLYPLHLVTLIVVAALQLAVFHMFGRFLFFTHNDAYHFFLNLFMISAWGFQQGQSYNDVIWSVSVEIAVYALFWVLHARLRQWGALGALAVAGVCGFIVLLGPPTFIFACGYYFFLGSAVVLARHQVGEARGAGPLLVAGLLAAGALGLASGHAILVPVLGLGATYGGLALLAVELDGHAGERLQAAARWLGECSYGIYLWHMPVLLALVLLISPFADIAHLATHVWFLAGYAALVVALARISYVRFENPARGLLRRLCDGLPAGRPIRG